MPQIIFIEKDGASRSCDFSTGETILSVAKRNAVDLEGACGGAMACSTCHVIIDALWYHRLPFPHSEEADMLDLTANVTRHSRLGCQIILTEACDGLKVRVA